MEQLSHQLTQIIANELDLDIRPVLTVPDPQFGDFSTNVAMQIAKQIGKNPREVAEIIAAKLPSATVAGPGFINITIPDTYYISELNKILTQPDSYGAPKTYENQVVVTEYSDPNPFKVLHIGHFYTSVVGDAISNLVESAGGKTHRVNFGGDVGLHVAKNIYAIIEYLGGEHPEKLAQIPEAERSDFLSARYVEGTSAYESDESAKEQIIKINAQIYDLHKTNDRKSPFAQIYWTCRQWSYDYFDAFYDRIGLKFEKYYPESETAQLGLTTVLEQKSRGVYEESEGAIIFRGEPHGLHTRVFINKNGLPTYEAKDVGLIFAKWHDYEFDKSIIITGNDIVEYMKVVLKSIEQFEPKLAERSLHLTHGMVKLAGGVKQSSRLGNFVKAVDIINLTTEAMAKTGNDPLEEVILGAIKYAFLKSRYQGDTIFDPETSVSLQGNSGPYLQYSLTRAKSILRQIEPKKSQIDSTEALDQFERPLAAKLAEFPSQLEKSVEELAPHVLCTYLYELAQTFNRFYENSKVAGHEREQIRAQLVESYVHILTRALTILGIPTPEKM